MLTEAEAQQHAESAARELRKLSYDELLARAQAPSEGAEALDRFDQHPHGEPFVSITISKMGRWRKRVSVEVVVTDEGWEKWGNVGCVYFERYASGKIWEPTVGPGIARVYWACIISATVVFAAILLWTLVKR